MGDDKAHLLDMVEMANRAVTFVLGYSEADFYTDPRTHWAVYSQLVLLGEAARRLSPQFREANPDLPWNKIIGMRNRIVHEYDEISWETVWRVVNEELPDLVLLLTKLAQHRGPDSN